MAHYIAQHHLGRLAGAAAGGELSSLPPLRVYEVGGGTGTLARNILVGGCSALLCCALLCCAVCCSAMHCKLWSALGLPSDLLAPQKLHHSPA